MASDISLFMEILNDCSDVDEIKFQEDGSWCPMRPKKEAMKVSSQPCTKIESSGVLSKPCSVTVAGEVSKKKVDVIDLTIESSSDEEEDPPAKRKCIFMSETQSSPTKGDLLQPQGGPPWLLNGSGNARPSQGLPGSRPTQSSEKWRSGRLAASCSFRVNIPASKMVTGSEPQHDTEWAGLEGVAQLGDGPLIGDEQVDI
ncbi:E3 SUMO-protein ligase PIAS2 [Heterocephalus glaber]|uniref:E3 SUMO-protein ligase PIAS2 n=1 Tax=Heterocephalus glaber TaxID=10181 RepID=G5BL87_HETGA|nr:E3 SUMO-protein ligase PIAS2 [Heterocephalus glaber]